MLNSLFGRDALVLRGVAEAHPASLLNNALRALGVGVDDEGTGGIVQIDFLERMARDPKTERSYWAGWKDYVIQSGSDLATRYKAVKLVEMAESISSGERQLVETVKPKTLYMEGCERYPSSVIGLVARNNGANVVYLDESFRPYLEWVESGFKKDLSQVQKGRESHWLHRVLANRPKGASLLIAGKNHLTPLLADGIKNNLPRSYIGMFPQMLSANGIRFSLYADLSRAGEPYSRFGSFASART